MQQNCALSNHGSRIEVVYRPIDPLRPDPKNARRHSRKQIRQVADCFGPMPDRHTRSLRRRKPLLSEGAARVFSATAGTNFHARA